MTRNSKVGTGILWPAHLPSCPASCKHMLFKLSQVLSAQLQRSWLGIDSQHSEGHEEKKSCTKL